MQRTGISAALKRSAFSKQNFHRQCRLLQTTARLQCASCNAQPAKQPLSETTNNPPVPPADHRALASTLDLFSTTAYSPGTPLLHPDGSHIFLKLQQFLRAQYGVFGFREVVSPTIYKQSLWEKSGHWTNYKDDMFQVRGGNEELADNVSAAEDQTYGLKPMNCPGHCLLFKSRSRSWRDLPIRYADFSPLHRNEISGALSGLTRVRRFHQDDGHIFCRPEQVGEEIQKTLRFVGLVYEAFGLGPYKLVLSTRPDQYIGEAAQWDLAESQLREALDTAGRGWELNDGDGAFYGPKIDITLKDSDGKEHQTATIQLDFQLPQRFELEYDGPEGESARPVMVHRAVLGSLERFMALLIEHFKGKWPFWLSPRQLSIITVNDEPETMEYVQHIQDELNGFTSSGEQQLQPLNKERYQITVDSRPMSVPAKVAQAKADRYNLIAVVGPKEVRDGTITVDLSGQPRIEALELPEFDTGTKRGKLSELRTTKWTPSGLHGVLRNMTQTFL